LRPCCGCRLPPIIVVVQLKLWLELNDNIESEAGDIYSQAKQMKGMEVINEDNITAFGLVHYACAIPFTDQHTSL